MKKVSFLIVALATLLVVIWFQDGVIMGTAEDSLIFHNISYFLPESQFSWMEHPGLGRATIGLTAARPTYEAITFLYRLGIPNFIIQAFVLWVILVTAGLGIYLLVKEFFPTLSDRYTFISILFYWFNPLSLVSVWNRFLSDYIFSFGLLPIAAFVFIKGLNSKRYLWLFILVLILPFYSFAFTYLAFTILLWIFFFFISLLFCLTHWQAGRNLFYLKYFLLSLFLFSLTNFWWIGQLASLNIFNNINSSVMNFDIRSNLGTLDALSNKLGNLSDIFRLHNASFLNENSPVWVKVFHLPPFMLIQFFVGGLILYSIMKGIKKTSVLILGGIIFVSIYLAKGTNPPFGEVYQFIFANIPFLQVFRNPFEKASFMLSLSASLLIGYAVFNLSQQIPKFKHLLYFIFLGIIVVVWGFPFYTGLVFTSSEPPANNPQIGYRVKVPSYYQEADQWLANKGNNFRFIGFPLGDEGITYNWEKGYSGVELSSALFSTPGILHNTAVPYYHDLVPEIQPILLSDRNFIRLANILNSRFFFVRHDINHAIRKMENPAVIDNNFVAREQNQEVKKRATFGQLTFWENLKWHDRTFYPGIRIVGSVKKQQVEELLNVDVDQGQVLVNASNIPVLDNNSIVKISYKRINPTKYVIHIQNSSPFILVFSELFNDVWQASYKGGVYQHIRVNFYANGWIIDKTGESDVIIEYLPQRLLDTGEKISIGSYLFVVAICLFLAFKEIKRRKA